MKLNKIILILLVFAILIFVAAFVYFDEVKYSPFVYPDEFEQSPIDTLGCAWVSGTSSTRTESDTGVPPIDFVTHGPTTCGLTVICDWYCRSYCKQLYDGITLQQCEDDLLPYPPEFECDPPCESFSVKECSVISSDWGASFYNRHSYSRTLICNCIGTTLVRGGAYWGCDVLGASEVFPVASGP